MSTIEATGTFTHETPTITVSGGMGNTSQPEVNLQMRTSTPDGEATHVINAWFDAGTLLRAIDDGLSKQ
ncbi:MAG: hypothetical protein ACTH32_06715 [Microbacterium gubbeenense]|uniref:hypothetical protein n=1 Tax=Microbacterium gubbeenense TaxID=159896 RepID=UPI003F99CCD6